MSYTFLLDAGEESSAECFSDIPASVLSRVSLTAAKSCCNGNETESCQGSQSGTMYGHSMENRGGGGVDVVCGGFPCQDISIGNNKAVGIEGDRSGLWAEQARVVFEIRPRYVFVENSSALVIRGLGTVLRDLAEMGYDARWGVFSAGDVGARHERERLWIVGHNDFKKRMERNAAKPLPRFSSFPWGEDVRNIEDLRKRPDLLAPGLCRKFNEVANQVDRLKAIGNGQVPEVVKLAWETMIA